jgi:mxaJ protein
MNPRTAAPFVTALLAALMLPAAADALTVCADPDYLPYSNRAGQGFENSVAEAVAKALGEKLEYHWASSRGHGGFPEFLAATLDAKRCDVVMNLPYGSREELTTRPYYISSYVFVFEKNKHPGITGLDSPALKRLRIGFERDTPAEDGLKIRGLIPGAPPGEAIGFNVGEDEKESPASMLRALKEGRIDVLITWQPAIGAFLGDFPGLEIVPLPNTRALGPPEQYTFPMSMGVRHNDEAMKRRLDEVIATRQDELAAILRKHGVLSTVAGPSLR